MGTSCPGISLFCVSALAFVRYLWVCRGSVSHLSDNYGFVEAQSAVSTVLALI
jgi:hypothetical protein